MAGLPPGDPQLVSMIVNHLKTQGLFDQFRRECLADVDTKPAYLNLKQRVDNFVSNHLSNHTWSPHLNKNQLRNNIRQLVLQSGMLEQGVDRIVAQVVDPKINHIFRPQVERVVREFLSPGSCVDEPNLLSTTTEPKTDSSEQVTEFSYPADTATSGAMSILDTISTLSQEATVKVTSEKGPKAEPLEEAMELDESEQDSSRIEESAQVNISEDTDEETVTAKVQELEVKMEEKDKAVTKTTAKASVEKQDEELKCSSQAKQKAKERIKEEYSLEDSDLEGLSDITVSSVHTSDLSSFEEESEDAQTPSDSSDEGELPDEEKTKEASDDGEEKQKPRRKAYVHKPFLYSRYYSDSDDEVTVEERRRSVAKDKEERLLKRQQNRERMEEKRKQKAAQAEEQNKKNQKSTDAATAERPRAKEARKERKVLEKKMALNRKRKLDSRKEEDVTSKKKETGEGSKKAETKPGSSKTPQQKLVRHLSESASPDERSRRMSGSISEEPEPKKISDKNRTHSFILELEQGSQEALKYRSFSKFDRPSRKELILKERKEKERHLLNQRAKLKQKLAEVENVSKESATVKEDKKVKSKSDKKSEKETGDVSSKDVKKVKLRSRKLRRDKAKGEKAKTDSKQLVRPESGGSSEDKSDLEPGSDLAKKKDKHPKEGLKRSKSHTEEKQNNPKQMKSSKSGYEGEKESKKSKITDKEKTKLKSKEDAKSLALSKSDKKGHSVSEDAPSVKVDKSKEKKKVEGKKEQRKEETGKLENKISKKKLDKKHVESKDDSRKEKSSKLEKTKLPKLVIPTEEQQKKPPFLPDTSTDSEPLTTTVTTSVSDDTCDALSDITPEPSEGETDTLKMPTPVPAEADALLALMNVCTSADARLPESSDQPRDVAQQEEADMKMQEAALTLLSMDPDSTMSSVWSNKRRTQQSQWR
ncbi:hypothetical protein WMY93_008811 [Mugilogobius chulae]|uniref:BOD1/SHG1 domain-containing protein n=1 Tax=Mugilogobius chulae TaxID=88201 RepID=A0AAW0PG60_9GOBI